MPEPPEQHLLERSEEIKWWVGVYPDRDVYGVYLVRYIRESGFLTDSQVFDSKLNRWNSYSEGELIEPTLLLPGHLVNILYRYEVLERAPIADAIKALCERIYEAERNR